MNRETCLPSELLEAPFPEHQVKTRPGAFGNSLAYLEGHTVIARLNASLEGRWSFEIVSHQILDDEVLVCGKLRAEASGVAKMAFGGSKITRNERTGQPVSISDDLKAAATDCVKKASSLLGVGLYLYGGGNGAPARDDGRPFEEELRAPRPRSGNGERQPSQAGNGDGRITNRQVSAVFSIARQKGMTNEEVRSFCRETYSRNIDYLSKQEASNLIERLLDR